MKVLSLLGNLAWAPAPAIENVEILDRFNGVPTLGCSAWAKSGSCSGA